MRHKICTVLVVLFMGVQVFGASDLFDDITKENAAPSATKKSVKKSHDFNHAFSYSLSHYSYIDDMALESQFAHRFAYTNVIRNLYVFFTYGQATTVESGQVIGLVTEDLESVADSQFRNVQLGGGGQVYSKLYPLRLDFEGGLTWYSAQNESFSFVGYFLGTNLAYVIDKEKLQISPYIGVRWEALTRANYDGNSYTLSGAPSGFAFQFGLSLNYLLGR